MQKNPLSAVNGTTDTCDRTVFSINLTVTISPFQSPDKPQARYSFNHYFIRIHGYRISCAHMPGRTTQYALCMHFYIPGIAALCIS